MAKKKSETTLEALIARLEEIATTIQSGDVGLEDAIKLYEEGKQLAQECNERLSMIQKKLEVINPSELKDDDTKDTDTKDTDTKDDSAQPPSDDNDFQDLGRDNPILLA
ncbi:MAG: exodeoxyribonuclease VII small subunit [Chloroherpetonaceae bacterium]